MKSTANTLSFGLKFAAVFALLFALFEASRGTLFEQIIVNDAVLGTTATLIDTMSPREAVRVEGRNLVSPDSILRVTRGCEGVEMFLLLTAGILAFPATAKHRLRGFLIGAVLAYALTLARLIMLHFALRYSPGAWNTLHGFVLPLGPVLLLALYFLHWSASDGHRAGAGSPMPAN